MKINFPQISWETENSLGAEFPCRWGRVTAASTSPPEPLFSPNAMKHPAQRSYRTEKPLSPSVLHAPPAPETGERGVHVQTDPSLSGRGQPLSERRDIGQRPPGEAGRQPVPGGQGPSPPMTQVPSLCPRLSQGALVAATRPRLTAGTGRRPEGGSSSSKRPFRLIQPL